MEEKSVTVVEQQNQLQTSVLDAPPAMMVEQVTAMANVLKDVIEKQKMFQKIGPNKYVTCEGWATLGTMLGVLPVEKEVKKIPNGYEAYINLVNKNTGVVIGGASNICTREEKTWKNRDEYAIRSMAITRATGKAYRLAFSWIVTMAGYKGTPAEEMPQQTAPAQEIYQHDHQPHFERLTKYLERREIPASHYYEISEKMNGKPITTSVMEEIISSVVEKG